MLLFIKARKKLILKLNVKNERFYFEKQALLRKAECTTNPNAGSADVRLQGFKCLVC
jgi:hypothetical protein